MKLLSPNAQKEAVGEEVSRSVFRTKEIRQAEKDAQVRLSKAEADFASMMARRQKQLEDDEVEHQNIIAERKRELADLEAKKLNMMVPFDIVNKRTEDRVKAANAYLSEIEERKEQNEATTVLLEEKLDAVGEREERVAYTEKKLTVREQGITRQQESVVLGAEKLTKAMKQFQEDKEKSFGEINERLTAIELRERSTASKEASQKLAIQRLTDWEKQLIDERGVLERAWKEIERISPAKNAE